jgi:hypothetical protein
MFQPHADHDYEINSSPALLHAERIVLTSLRCLLYGQASPRLRWYFFNYDLYTS